MLNGKHYDALTGSIIKESSTPKAPTQAITHGKTGSVDGVVTSTKQRQHAAQQSKRKIEHSKTLMRSSVKKPTPKPTSSADNNKKLTKPSAAPDIQRERRAKQVQQSSRISKFGIGAITKKPTLSPLPVVKAPDIAPTTPIAKNPLHTAKSVQLTHKTALQSAVDASNSHAQPKLKRTNRRAKVAHRLRVSPRLLNAGLVMLAVLMLGGYFAYNNTPNLSMRIASTRSGLNGALPGYQPAGFAMKGPIQYQPGQITVAFRSNSDDRNYTLNERTSNWDSEALLENHVAVNKRSYQTFQDKGKTIYIYDGDSASWMDNGVWYEIKGNASLDTDQMLRIANSL